MTQDPSGLVIEVPNFIAFLSLVRVYTILLYIKRDDIYLYIYIRAILLTPRHQL